MENIVPSWPGVHREEPEIKFTSHLIPFTLPKEEEHRQWLLESVAEEGFTAGNIGFIFCSDDFLLEMNRKHLHHNDYTDIITFPYDEDPLSGEIFISIERVKENASAFDVEFEEELRRVMIHGILHLCGYDDHDNDDIEEIRAKEAKYLDLI